MEDTQYECNFCGNKIEKNKKNKNICQLQSWKQILLFVIGFLGFQTLAYLFSFIFSLMVNAQLEEGTYQYYNLLTSYKPVGFYNFLSYLVLFPILGALLIPNATEICKSFRHFKPFIASLVGVAGIMIFNIVYNNIIYNLGLSINNNSNETTVVNIVSQYPVFSVIVFGLIGPITEELTYRVGLFSFFSRINKILAYVITIIVFAFIHYNFSSSDFINELLNLPLYAFAAFVFSFLYDRYGLAGSVYAHVINNLMSILATISSTMQL